MIENLDQQPAFLVGVTGHWDLLPEQIETLKERVRCVFRLLRHGSTVVEGRGRKRLTPDGEAFFQGLDRLEWSDCSLQHQLDEVHASFLNDWPGLGEMPIVILSALAPGADQLVAEVALEEEFQESDFQVVAPLPFPMPEFEAEAKTLGKTYRDASTFVRRGLTSEEIKELQRQLDGPATEDRPEGIVRRMLLHQGPESGFTVMLKEDLEFETKEAWFAQCVADLEADDPTARRRRYQAAGEYVAAYSHLMLAIWDHLDDSDKTGGTAQIVSVRQRGLTPKLLPVAHDLPMPLGPTLQLFTERRNRKRGDSPAVSNPPWHYRWLFPPFKSESIPELTSHRQVCQSRIEDTQLGLDRLVKQGCFLRDLVNLPPARNEKIENDVETYLSDTTKPEHPAEIKSIRKQLEENASVLLPKTERLIGFRRRILQQQYQEGDETSQNLRKLFLLTFFAVLLIHTYNNWHPQNEPQPVVAARGGMETSAVNDTVSGTSDQSVEPSTPAETSMPVPPADGATFVARIMRVLFGGTGFGLAIYALWFFWRRKPEQHEEKNHDLRAIAEGVRVQMLWFLAGIGRSVPANYMLRQRAEFQWLRAVIRSVSFPYEQAYWEFRKLPRGLQLRLLKSVFHNWLRGHENNAQSNYFAKKKQERLRQIHFFRRSGTILVLSGVLIVFAHVVAAIADLFLGTRSMDSLADGLWTCYFCWLLLVPLILVIWAVRHLSRLKGWKGRYEWSVQMLEKWIPIRESNEFAHSRKRFLARMLHNFLIYLVPAILIAGSGILLNAMLSRSGWFPPMGTLSTIISAFLFLAGGLCIAWSEKNLDAELAGQYGNMYHLFQIAANHVEVQILRLQHLESIMNDRAAAIRSLESQGKGKGESEEESEWDKRVDSEQATAQADFDELVRQTQNALYELGIESLDENAEWLILHRARPLEPLMAG